MASPAGTPFLRKALLSTFDSYAERVDAESFLRAWRAATCRPPPPSLHPPPAPNPENPRATVTVGPGPQPVTVQPS